MGSFSIYEQPKWERIVASTQVGFRVSIWVRIRVWIRVRVRLGLYFSCSYRERAKLWVKLFPTSLGPFSGKWILNWQWKPEFTWKLVSYSFNQFLSNLHTTLADYPFLCFRELLEEEQITVLCIQHLGLRSLTRCTSLNHFEMISCCENLMNIANTLTKGLMVKIGQVYHMSADGELTIPWNWKERG